MVVMVEVRTGLWEAMAVVMVVLKVVRKGNFNVKRRRRRGRV